MALGRDLGLHATSEALTYAWAYERSILLSERGSLSWVGDDDAPEHPGDGGASGW